MNIIVKVIERNKTLSVEQYLSKTRPYLTDLVNDLKKYDTWEIQLTISIKFISSEDNGEECAMNSKDDLEIKFYDKADNVIEEIFQSLLSRYQIGLETSLRGSDFILDCGCLLYYKCHKINFKLHGSYIDSPDWIRNKKATINPINKKYNKCFQFTVTVSLKEL